MKSLFILLCTIPFTLFGQEDNKVGYWYMYFGNYKLDHRFNWYAEVQSRNHSLLGGAEQQLIRTGVGIELDEKNDNNLLLGYGYIETTASLSTNVKDESIEEHRIYQQLINQVKYGKLNLTHRFRLEERFIKSNFLFRLRYLLSIKIPINENLFKNNSFHLSFYNELFVDKKLLERDRMFGAIGYAISDEVRLEVGIMTQVNKLAIKNQFQVALYNDLSFID